MLDLVYLKEKVRAMWVRASILERILLVVAPVGLVADFILGNVVLVIVTSALLAWVVLDLWYGEEDE